RRRRVEGRTGKVFPVRLNRLTEQRHLAHAPGAMRPHLSGYLFYRARALSPAPVGNAAVCTELITAVDYGHERRRPLRLREGVRPELATQLRFRHHVPQDDLEALRARPDVDVRKSRAKVVRPRPHHAAHDRDLEPAVTRLLQLAQHS